MKIYQINSERNGYTKSWELLFVIKNKHTSILMGKSSMKGWAICERTILKYNKD